MVCCRIALCSYLYTRQFYTVDYRIDQSLKKGGGDERYYY
jgi:hypothetical protein